MKRLYYELGGETAKPALAALRALVPSSQILFGTDYPYRRIEEIRTGLASLGLSSADEEAIGHRNARALFPRLKA